MTLSSLVHYTNLPEADHSCLLQIPGSEKILETVSGADRGNKFANILKKTGLTKAAMSSFGEPELLDDLVDHWNAGNHKEVRSGSPSEVCVAQASATQTQSG